MALSRYANALGLIQFLTSRVSTPKPFKPKHLRQFSDSEIEALERLNLNSSPHANGSPLSSSKVLTAGDMGLSTDASSQAHAQRVDIAKLEAKAANEHPDGTD